ncbi:MAG TPA: carbohydrate-binding protein [Candidatus Paceibacterota bacterium]|nr:carbohydrate-binding protein [Candidatus Paceibacterota bacterium]
MQTSKSGLGSWFNGARTTEPTVVRWRGGLSALLKAAACGALIWGCGDSAQQHNAADSDAARLGSAQQTLTQGIPYRIRALDYSAFHDSDTVHEGNCGSGPVDAETTSDPDGGACDVGWTHPGEWLEYSLQVAVPGKFNIVPRVASAQTGKTFRVSLDGVDLAGALSVPSAGWQAFADRLIKDVPLSAGQHTLRVSFETGDTNLNYIDVAPGTTALPARIEAENYQRSWDSTPDNNQGSACDRRDGVDKEGTGDTAGGACDVGWTTAGEWLEYDVNVVQAGSYAVLARLASASSGHSVKITVDGADVGTLSVPNLGWSSFQDRTLPQVNFSAGAHVLRVTFVDGQTNLNYLNITSNMPVPVLVPHRIKALSYTAFQDSDTIHEGSCGTGPVDAETTTDPSGGDCDVGYTHPGEWLDYSIQVPASGKYDLTARVASALTAKTVRLLIDGQNVSGSLSVPSSGWQAFADRAAKDVSLSTGIHTLRVLFETGDTNLNYIDVAPGTVELPARIEAEDYQRALDSTPATNSGGACDRGDGVDKETTTDPAGGACDVGWTTSTEWLEYDVKVAQAGAFNIAARVGSAVDGTSVLVALDGTSLGTLAVPNIGWTSFEDRTLSNVNFSAGTHTLRVSFPQGQVNLNFLNLTAVPSNVPPSTAQSFGAAAAYNVFLFQDLQNTPSIAGPVAVGRDIFTQTFGYNTVSSGTIGVLVGRSITASGGSIHRDLVYGVSQSLTNAGVLDGVIRQASPLNFANEKTYAQGVSGGLAALTANGATNISADGRTINFVGTSAARNVFSVAGAVLAATDVLSFTVPSTSTVVVNVTGGSASFETGGVQLGGLAPGHLIWNFRDADSVRLSQMGFKGTLLAPNAIVSHNGVDFEGALIAQSLYGTDNGIAWAPFNGPWPLGCATNADCGSGRTCQAGACQCTICSPTCTCGSGGSCTQTADCSTGFTCAGGSCHPLCETNPTDPHCVANSCVNGMKDGSETDVDCGGNCPDCGKGQKCGSDADCGSGLSCGAHNGACFAGSRSDSVCWPTQCGTGAQPTECGQQDSLCGSNCACVASCDPQNPSSCPSGQQCKTGIGPLFHSSASAVCVDPRCPSDDPALCGQPDSLCGISCVGTPDCSTATCQNPDDHHGGRCPGVCGPKAVGCKVDADCTAGYGCVAHADGTSQCLRADICQFRTLAPPLCGGSDALCGPCPTCTPQCAGRACGPDPSCGSSCGTCGAGTSCSIDGQCVQATVEPPIVVHDSQGGTHPIPELMPGPTSAVGALPGSFAVSEAGTAQYSIPIQVPPGRAGIEPAVSLVYSGSRSNGDLGLGWRLEGLSAITRCPRSYALDGYSRNVSNTVDDRFCLDGKRLEAVNGGAYGANGTEYRTLVDSFAKVTSFQDLQSTGIQVTPWISIPNIGRLLQGPDSFEVRTKDGRILTYGTTPDSLVVARNGLRNAWLLTQVKDRSGNTMQVQYLKTETNVARFAGDRFPSVIRPMRIAYTGHNETPGNREVDFDYEARPDPQVSFLQGGVPGVADQRLWRIRTSVNQVPVKNYRIKYPTTVVDEAGGTLSLIQSVTECAGDSDLTCKKPTRFEYVADAGFEQNPGLASPLFQPGVQLDANGDGIYDFAHRTVTVDDVNVSNVEKGVLLVGDIGTTVLAVYPATSAVGVPAQIVWTFGKEIYGSLAHQPDVHISTDISLSTGNRANLYTSIPNFGVFPCSDWATPGFLMDYDQDGDHDFMGQCPLTPYNMPQQCPDLLPPDSLTCSAFVNKKLGSTLWQFYVSRSDGTGHYVSDFPRATLQFPVYGYLASAYYGQRPQAFDVNGDGLEDILACRNLDEMSLYRRLPPPADFEPNPIVFKVPDHLCLQQTPSSMIVDVDGDGVANLMIRGETMWHVMRYTESGGQPTISWQDDVFPDAGFSGAGALTSQADFNGDGLLDLWSDYNNVAWLSTGTGTFEPRNMPPRSVPPGFGFQPSNHLSTLALDYKGHGRSDLLELWDREFINGNGLHIFTINYQAQIPDSLLTTFSSFPNTQIAIPHLVEQSEAGLWQAVTDVDGDGNNDLVFAHGDIAFGKGAKNNLLKRVEDGLGNFINVDYDQTAYQAEASCKSGTQWPERCMPRLQGLVSRYTEGFTVTGQTEEHAERHYDYRYFNARMNVTGHGWLGFDRVESQAFAGDMLRNTTTTEFEPLIRRGLNGQAAATTVPPYAYPLAGLAKKVTVDFPAFQSALTSGPFARRVVTDNVWEVGTSASGRPFPKLSSKSEQLFDRPASAAPTDAGTLLMNTFDTYVVDDYGNLTVNTRDWDSTIAGEGQRERRQVFAPVLIDAANWLTSSVRDITIISSRGGDTKTQNWHKEYYPNGTLHSVTRAPNEDALVMTAYVRNDFGNVIEVIEQATSDQPVRATSYGYDNDQVFATSITNSLAQTTQLAYDQRWGTQKLVVDPNQIVALSAYDDFGRLAATQTPAGTRIITLSEITAPNDETSAGPINEKIEVAIDERDTDSGPIGHVVRHLDNYGRSVRTSTTAIGGEILTEAAYDQSGRLTGETLPHLSTSAVVPSVSYNYDPLDRLVRSTHSDGKFTETQYASPASLVGNHGQWLSNLCSSTFAPCGVDVAMSLDESFHSNVTITDHHGQVLRSIDGNSVGSTPPMFNSYGYGAFGRLLKTTDNLGNETSYEFDAYGRLRSITDPDSGTTTNTYTGFDDLSTITDQRHRHRSLEHDALGRLTQVKDGSTVTATWNYDSLPDRQLDNAIGRITAATVFSPNFQRTTYAYEDAAAGVNRGLLKQADYELDGVVHSVGYTYDNAARLKQTRYPDSFGGEAVVTENTYDPSGVLTKVERVRGAQKDKLWQVEQTFEGYLLQQESFGNGAVSSYVYNPQRRWIESINTVLGGDEVQQIGYTHYDNGQVRSRQQGDINRNYYYDALARLSSTLDEFANGSFRPTQYAYDQIGNLSLGSVSSVGGPVSVNYQHSDPANPTRPQHLVDTVTTPHGTTTYHYDPNGNVSSRVGPDVPGGQQTISYTPFDLPDSITSGTKTTTFEYSAFEKRTIQRTSESTRYYVGDVYQRMVGTGPNDTVEQRFEILAEGRRIGEIVRNGAAEETLYFHSDHLDSVETVTTSAGNVTHQSFDPFGAPMDSAAPKTRFGFTGQAEDGDLGLIDMRGRLFDTLAGRFTTPDPIVQAPFWSQGLNRYAYVFNDPVNATDPSGFQAVPMADYPGGYGYVFADDPLTAVAPAASSTSVEASASAEAASSSSVASYAGPIITGIVNIYDTLTMGSKGSTFRGSPATPSAPRATHPGVKQTGAPHEAKGPVGPPPGRSWQAGDIGPPPPPPACDELCMSATGYGPALGHPLLDEAAPQIPDTSEGWHNALDAVMLAEGGVEGLFEIGVTLAERLAPRAAARALATEGAAAGAGRTFKYVCFAAGTEVHTETGLRAIEEVAVGDLVWGRDETTGDVALRRVTRTFVTPDQTLLEVVFDDGHENVDRLKATGEHPFWVRGQGWTKAMDLQPGDPVLARSGESLFVTSVTWSKERETVYNFEVEDLHTYFVGRLGAWVHNSCWDDIAEHVLHRFPGQTKDQVAAYLKNFANSAGGTTTQSGARIWRRGAEILIQRPGAGAGGTYFRSDSVKAAARYLERFITEEGGAAF